MRVFITVDGGLIQDVCADTADIEVVVVDLDIDGADEDELAHNTDNGCEAFVARYVTDGEVGRQYLGWLTKEERVQIIRDLSRAVLEGMTEGQRQEFDRVVNDRSGWNRTTEENPS